MKIWRFYIVRDYEEYMKLGVPFMEDIPLKNKYPLYAVTTNKEYAERFKKSRKKGTFICSVDSVTKKEAKDYMRRNRQCVLSFYPLKTYPSKDKDECGKVNILMNEMERDQIDSGIDTYAILMYIPTVNPKLFRKDSIGKKLCDPTKSDYIELYKLQFSALYEDEINAECDWDTSDYRFDNTLYFDRLDWTFDELGTFIYLFSDEIENIEYLVE